MFGGGVLPFALSRGLRAAIKLVVVLLAHVSAHALGPVIVGLLLAFLSKICGAKRRLKCKVQMTPTSGMTYMYLRQIPNKQTFILHKYHRIQLK